MVGIRVPPEMIARLDRIAAALAERAEGSEVRRSDAARVALELGVEALERKLALDTETEGGKPARKPKS